MCGIVSASTRCAQAVSRRGMTWTATCTGRYMNHNSLIIATDGSRARLFRVGETNDVARPVELIEVGSCTALGGGEPLSAEAGPAFASQGSAGHLLPGRPASREELGVLARRIAERAGAFGRDHICNPVIVVASRAAWPVVSYEVEHTLPNVYLRPVYGEVAGLDPQQILERLQNCQALA